MPRLFSYGSLQQEAVQRATFGRPLSGQRDELVGFEVQTISRGNKQLANVRRVAHGASRVRGTVFEISDAELNSADAHERKDSYVRVPLALASGGEAWVYVDSASAD